MKLGNKGFTLVELLVAMTFFSFLLLLVTFGFVQINRSYTRGITVKTIQETARALTEDISRAIRTSNDFEYHDFASDGEYRLCLGDVNYAWNQHIEKADPDDNKTLDMTTEQLDSLPPQDFTMVKTRNTAIGCLATIAADDTEEVLDDRAIIQHLSITNVAEGTYKIKVVVSTKSAADNDLEVFGSEARCKVQTGDQFCDVASLETVVKTRK